MIEKLVSQLIQKIGKIEWQQNPELIPIALRLKEQARGIDQHFYRRKRKFLQKMLGKKQFSK